MLYNRICSKLFRSKHDCLRQFSSFSNGTSGPKFLFSRENVPIFALTVGMAALCFQIAVLYPWHYELSKQMDDLEKITVTIRKESESLDKKMDTVIRLEEDVKRKEKLVLEREDDILKNEGIILSRLDEVILQLNFERERSA